MTIMNNQPFGSHSIWLCIVMLFLASCQAQPESPAAQVDVEVDGRVLTFQVPEPLTVEAFLAEVDIDYSATDRIVPQLYSQVTDGMRITIRRVSETEECQREEVPYEIRYQPNEGLAEEEELLVRQGQNGEREICFRIVFEDGVEVSRQQIGQPEFIREPVDEIIMVGIDTDVEPIAVTGTLAYINNGNAWVIRGTADQKRRLTETSNLDGLVLSLTPDGRFLLYTTQPADDEGFVNELWVIDTSGTRDPVQLVPTDVLYAEWVPGLTNTISYSTSEVRDFFPFWKALNNLWTIEIDPETGSELNPRQVVEESQRGFDAWWGTVFKWSPDGQAIAWVAAEAVGLVGDEGDFVSLTTYPLFSTSQNWSWRANASWSWDSTLIATTVHGPPVGREPPESSPVFNVVVLDSAGNFQATIADSAGIWASPQFSPPLADNTDATFPTGYLAYLQAREPFASITSEYDLMVADRDGSNLRNLFPGADRPGITVQVNGLTNRNYTWSPDGSQIATIYQGDLWVVDVESGLSYQLTFDGGSSFPIWTR